MCRRYGAIWSCRTAHRAPIEHWECILGRAKASDIVLTGEGIERSHAAIQRSGAGEWTLSALDGGRGVWLNGKAVTGDAPLHGGDTIQLGKMELHFLALDDAQRATLQRKRPVTGHKVQPAVTLLLLVCFQLVLLFQFFFTTDGAALAYIVLLVRTAHCHGMVLLFCDAQHFRARI